MNEKYSSIPDTKEHIGIVIQKLTTMALQLIDRAQNHDKSKLEEPELSVFDEVTPRLKNLTYGSPEYKESLNEMGVALSHHYIMNRHHPEHFENGIKDMNLIDKIEMIADWKAAVQRHDDGDINKSMEINRIRFNISDYDMAILRAILEVV